MEKQFSWKIDREFLTSRKLILIVILVGSVVRAWTIFEPRGDFDEPTFLELAQAYAGFIRNGAWHEIPQYTGVQEHPAFVKLLFTIAVLATDSLEPRVTFLAARSISAMFGVMTLGLVSLVNPLAAGILAVHTMEVKYTSEIYLEAVAQFTSFAAVYAFSRSTKLDIWFGLSVFFIGLTAASKYTYFPAIVAVAYIAYQQQRSWTHYLLYVVIAGIVFLIFNPTLWPNPPLRLWESLTFHSRYSQSDHVQLSGFPWYQPFIWLVGPAAYYSHRLVYFGFDWLPFSLSLIGLPLQWQRRPWVVFWYLAGIVALLLWPSKWPQYPMIILVPLCLSAGDVLLEIFRRIRIVVHFNSASETLIRFNFDFDVAPTPAPILAVEANYSSSRWRELTKRLWLR
jgi:hypothetical protein